MGKLTAIYYINLPTELYFLRSQSEGFHFETRLEDFDVELIFGRDEEQSGPISHQEPDKRYVVNISEVKISVSRYETANLPENGPTTAADGSQSTLQLEYLKELESEYRNIAEEILNRAILFFKYKLKQGQLVLLDFHHNRLISGFKWIDAKGNQILSGAQLYMTLPRKVQTFLTVDRDAEFIIALENRIVPELYEEILADARGAMRQGNLRRAVLEMAIACEILIKQTFFSKSTPAGEAFEFLEESRNMEVPSIEFIHKVAERAFGESFQKAHQVDWNNIDRLFRCRNKVAHRGQAVYRDEKGLHEVNRDTLQEWWGSVETLIEWLKKHTI